MKILAHKTFNSPYFIHSVPDLPVPKSSVNQTHSRKSECFFVVVVVGGGGSFLLLLSSSSLFYLFIYFCMCVIECYAMSTSGKCRQ